MKTTQYLLIDILLGSRRIDSSLSSVIEIEAIIYAFALFA